MESKSANVPVRLVCLLFLLITHLEKYPMPVAIRSYKQAGLLDGGKVLGFEQFTDVIRNQVSTCYALLEGGLSL